MGINKAILVGNVGKDPEIQYIREDVPVARFSLATSETYRDKNGQKTTTTEWHNIVMWRGLAKIAEQYIKKGTQLYIEGKITHRSYEQDGVTKYFHEIVARDIQLLGRASDTNSEYKPIQTSSETTNNDTAQPQPDSEKDDQPQVDILSDEDESDGLPF